MRGARCRWSPRECRFSINPPLCARHSGRALRSVPEAAERSGAPIAPDLPQQRHILNAYARSRLDGSCFASAAICAGNRGYAVGPSRNAHSDGWLAVRVLRTRMAVPAYVVTLWTSQGDEASMGDDDVREPDQPETRRKTDQEIFDEQIARASGKFIVQLGGLGILAALVISIIALVVSTHRS